MIEYLTHYYKSDSIPFRSLSELSELDAISLMHSLRDDSPLFSRFNDPSHYLTTRRKTEDWLVEQYKTEIGKPANNFPIYAVLGVSNWIERYSANYEVSKIHNPITLFNETDVSFTYPDSMVSFWLGTDKPVGYFDPDYHGRIFTLREVKELIKIDRFSEENWGSTLPKNVAPYIEAQIWNHNLLNDFINNIN